MDILFIVILIAFAILAIVQLCIDEVRENDIFYDPFRCEQIISRYSGSTKMRILRALSAGELRPADIKRFYICGKSGCPVDQEYILINNLARPNRYVTIPSISEPNIVSWEDVENEYIVKRLDSGSNRSVLTKNELCIENGKALITQHWECA